MAARFLSDEDIQNIITGREDDPFSLLGFHRLLNRHKSAAVRLFAPMAEAAMVITPDAQIPMEKVHAGGLFEAFVPEDIGPYRFLISTPGGQLLAEDAYRFPSALGELDSHLVLEGNHLDLYKKMGAHIGEIDGVRGTSFAVWAPNAYRVSAVGEWNRWDGRVHAMRRHPVSGIWDIFIPDVQEGALYKYEIIARDGRMTLKSDPYGFFHEMRPKTASIVWDNSRYKWASNPAWEERRKALNAIDAPMSIYEVHPGSWKRKDGNLWLSWRELAHDLVPYAKWMGFTHIELMPATEHPLDGSWGYQPTGMFAPTSRHGTPDDFKYLVEQCHNAGLGLILDWVGAHFPKDGHGLAEFDGRALYEYPDPKCGEHKDWGTKIYDFSRNEVANFLLSSALFWLEEYRADGLRFDAVASMLYLDYSRGPGEWRPNAYGGNENLEAIAFLKKINTAMYGRQPMSASFAEESTGWPRVSKPVEAGGLGFGYKWNMGWMHNTLDYMGREPVHRKHHHHQMTHSIQYAFSENFVLPLSHDEVVHMKGSLLNKMPGDRWQKFANLRALYGYMWTFPGKKLLFMGGEFAQPSEWSEERSLDWHVAHDPLHHGIQKLVRALNMLYAAEPALYENNSGQACFEWINWQDAESSIFSYARHAKNWDDFLIVVANMTPIVRENYRIGVPKPGSFIEIFNTDAFEYGGSGATNGGPAKSENIPRDGRRQSISINVPPLAVAVLKPVK